MTFFYFAYGSNMWEPQLLRRCRSARSIGTGAVRGYRPVYDKPGADGSAKLNIEPAEDDVLGVIYEISDEERGALDRAEPGYHPIDVEVFTSEGLELSALTYLSAGESSSAPPRAWYVSMAREGARAHGLPAAYYGNHLGAEGSDDPLAGDLRVAGEDDLPAMQAILSDSLEIGDGRYTPHPGDLAWWMWHPDPRPHVHNDSFWIQDDRAVVFIDSSDPGEIAVVAREGVARAPLIDWARKWLGGRGEVAWIGAEDAEIIAYLGAQGMKRAHTDVSLHWNLVDKPVPEPDLPPGWVLRHVEGEHEADNRRAASHAAFQSTMDHDGHLNRYLGFMRSPVYAAERDLVAVAPDGRIAAFMVWWPDETGIAQIEPFGTHPDFHRRGVGRALMYHGLRKMREAGMRVARVVTDVPRTDATSFYPGVGFDLVGEVHWWA